MLIPPKKVLVSIRALCKDFRRPNGSIFTALEGVNLDIYDGEFLSILGLSGSGKSTLLRCIADIQKPDRGHVSFATLGSENLLHCSVAFQTPALFPWLTVAQNIEIALGHLPRERRKEQVEEMLTLGGLSGFDDGYPRDLSSGMKQRVNICRALAANPMVFCMDEPFTALDPLTGQSLRAEIERLWMSPERKIRAMVLATHNVREAVQLSDRIVILSAHPGRVYRNVEVQLPRPRNPNDAEYEKIESFVEKLFGELHLDKIGLDEDVNVQVPSSPEPQETPKPKGHKSKRVRPIIRVGLVSIEGLCAKLVNETEPMDIYDLCEELGQTIDEMLHVVSSSEHLGFVTTPGTDVVLTEAGLEFAQEQDPTERRNLFRAALLRHPLILHIYNLLDGDDDKSIPKSAALEQISLMLPFEDSDAQFDALVTMCRYADLFAYDPDKEVLFIES